MTKTGNPYARTIAIAAICLAAAPAPVALADSYAPVTTFGGPGTGPGQLAEPRGVAVDRDGNVFVADAANSRIQRFTPAPGGLQYQPTGIIQGTKADPLFAPQAIALGPDGSVFVTDTAADRNTPPGADAVDVVRKYVPDSGGSGAYALVATLKVARKGLDNPRGVAVAPDGSVFISDKNNHRVVRCEARPDGAYAPCVRELGGLGVGLGELQFPKGIAFDTQGNLFVADTSNNRIQKFTRGSDETYAVTAWGSEGAAAGQFRRPGDVAVDAGGNVFVVDKYNHRVQKFRPVSDGVYEYSFAGLFGVQGTDTPQLEEPLGLAVDGKGFVYVSDSGNSRIKKFGPDQDADGVADVLDNCPTAANADQADPNRNGRGAACDSSDAPQRVLASSAVDRTPPKLSRVRILRRQIRDRGKRRTVLAGVRYTLSEDATVGVRVISRRSRTKGGRSGRSRVTLSLERRSKAGVNTIRLSARRGRRIAPGRLQLIARDAAGNRSETKALRFTLRR